MNEEAFYIGTDTTIIVSNLRDAITDVVISDAVITGILYDMDDNPIANGTITCPATLVVGEYAGSLRDDLALTAGIQYYLELTIVKDTATLITRLIRFARYYVE